LCQANGRGQAVGPGAYDDCVRFGEVQLGHENLKDKLRSEQPTLQGSPPITS
jgi:hypothetical protein